MVMNMVEKTGSDQEHDSARQSMRLHSSLNAVNDSMLEGLGQLSDYFGYNKVMGKMFGALGRHNINIANFALGRSSHQHGTEAVAVVQVDSPAPEEVLQELRQAAPEIQEVKSIQF